MNSISLFTGAGGLDLGLEKAGFNVQLCVDIDEVCRRTIAENRPNWKISSPGDINLISPREIIKQSGFSRKEVDLISGGAPCQPFSKSGLWVNGKTKRFLDHRSTTVKKFFDLVAFALPRNILFENVPAFAKAGADATTYVKRLLTQINNRSRTAYKPQVFLINAAEYGVPQLRQRLFVFANRDGLQIELPSPTHSASPIGKQLKFLTAWDAIGDIENEACPDRLSIKSKWADLLPSIPEGKNYLWHTSRSQGVPIFEWRTRYWNFLLKLAKNLPSWTIQANPGPATGPFHWANRRLSERELMRLQTFPDDFFPYGSWNQVQRQIGNAVPPALGELFGKTILNFIYGEQKKMKLSLIPSRNMTFFKAARCGKVPRKYV